MKKILTVLLICCALFPVHSVLAASADTTILPVLSRGHIQDLGDYPADGSWVESPNRIGTVGQSKRIEGFELKAADSLPADVELRYNVHVQNIGWLYDENDPSSWAKNGDYAGTRGNSLRIEAIKIVLLDASGTKASGYHIRYQGHVQNIGDLPADSEQWFVDGEQLGTVGSSLRLEALKLEIIKDAATNPGLNAYTTLIKKINSLNESDYSKASWLNLQTVLKNHVVTDKNTAEEVAAAVKTINAAMQQLENLSTITDYHKPGTYGPNSGSETINQDVIITSTGVTLQNLTIDGNLIIDEAVGDGEVTLNNVNVTGELRVRGGGKNSIHINGGAYSKIMVEQTPDGGVRIVASGLDGVPVVLSENAAGETLILEGSFESVTVNAPDVVIKTQGQTSIKSFDVAKAAQNAAIDLGPTTTVTNLALSSPTKVTGTGTVSKAEIASDNVSFEKAPQDYTVEPGVVVPPVIPKPTPQPQPGGGSGGGYTPPSKINLSVTSPPVITISKSYDGNTATDVTAKAVDETAITGIAAGDNVSVLATATYDDKNVRTDKTITITYSLSGTNADKYNPPAATTVKGEIVKKALRSPATPSVSKEFDGTTTLDTVITEDLGQVASDKLTITRSATYQNSAGNATDAKEVGTGKTVQYSYRLSGTDASNYTAPADQSGTGTITKRTLSVSAASLNINKTKTYDGTTDVYNSAGNIITSGNNSINVATGVAGDANINVTATVAYNDQYAGGKTITVSYTIGGTSANSRYQVTPTETISNASITPCQLTIPANQVPTPVAKAYDGTGEVFTLANNAGQIYDTPVTPNNIASGDAGKVTVTATANYDAGKNVGTGKKTTIHYTLSGDAASNYLAPPDDQSKIADITPLTLKPGTIDATTKTKEYDGTSTAGLGISVGLENQLSNSVFSEELTKGVLGFDRSSKYYSDSACQTETSEPSDTNNPYIKYTITLTGASAGNYVFSGNSSTFTGTTNGGMITKKTLTANNDFINPAKTYDGNTLVYSNTTPAAPITDYSVTSLNGVVSSENITVKASAVYGNPNVGDRSITVTYSLSGAAADHYQMNDATITENCKINPIQLSYTGTLPSDISSYSNKTYDGTATVRLNGNYIEMMPVTSDVTGIISGDTAKVTATATFNDKNAGTGKPVTITYAVDSTNYLAPPTNTGTITASIDKRMLVYADGLQVKTLKKAEENRTTSATVSRAAISTTANTSNLIVAGDTVTLAGCTGEYYSGGQPTSAVTPDGTWYEIRLTPTLNGADKDNYVMESKCVPGMILPANAVIGASYNGGTWSNWNYSNFGKIKTISPSSDMKLFMYSGDIFYSLGSDGKIYTATDAANLTNWTPFTSSYIDTNANLSLAGYQVFGVDSIGQPLAVGSDGTIYFWQNTGWLIDSSAGNQGKATLQGNVAPVNPTYYTDGTSEYLIYQDSTGNIYKSAFGGSSPTKICDGLTPLSDFNRQLIYYDGTNVILFGY